MAVGVSWAAVFRRLRGSICMKEREKHTHTQALASRPINSDSAILKLIYFIQWWYTGSTCSIIYCGSCILVVSLGTFGNRIVLVSHCLKKVGNGGSHGKDIQIVNDKKHWSVHTMVRKIRNRYIAITVHFFFFKRWIWFHYTSSSTLRWQHCFWHLCFQGTSMQTAWDTQNVFLWKNTRMG